MRRFNWTEWIGGTGHTRRRAAIVCVSSGNVPAAPGRAPRPPSGSPRLPGRPQGANGQQRAFLGVRGAGPSRLAASTPTSSRSVVTTAQRRGRPWPTTARRAVVRPHAGTFFGHKVQRVPGTTREYQLSGRLCRRGILSRLFARGLGHSVGYRRDVVTSDVGARTAGAGGSAGAPSVTPADTSGLPSSLSSSVFS